MYSKIFQSLLVMMFLLSMVTNGSAATAITYMPTDLPDNTPGEDLWRYDYQVSGSFAAFEGFSVLFNPELYQNLQNVSMSDPVSWNLLTVQPDANLGDGYINALALTSISAKSTDFVWLGTGTPGIQSFEIHDDSFQITQTGTTQASIVPIPGSFILYFTGLILLARRSLFQSSH